MSRVESPRRASLTRNLLLTVALVLTVFFGLAIGVLDNAFRQAAIQAEQEQLDIQLIALLAAADGDVDNGLRIPNELNEQRLQTPGSGLYAEVFDASGERVWRSPSALGLSVPWLQSLDVGTRRFERLTLGNGTELLSFALAVNWAFSESESQIFTFHVAESLDSYHARVGRFRTQLFTWFGAIALALIVTLVITLRSLLAPLGQIRREIVAVERGQRRELSRDFPVELAGVARNLNTLIDRERDRGELYRRTLGDLAHSLKTPLATLRATLGSAASEDALRELDRLDELIRYQLAKPQTRGRTLGAQPVPIKAAVDELLASFSKIYHDKDVSVEASIADSLIFTGDRGDLLELLGNLLDNAFKRCRTQVAIAIDEREVGATRIVVDDDGPGFPEGFEAQELERGKRLDEVRDSHGLGLAIVSEILGVYDAQMKIDRASLGGARVIVVLPAP